MRTTAAKIAATTALAAALFLGTESLAQATTTPIPAQSTATTNSNPWDQTPTTTDSNPWD
ncbi:hypothetical protein UO65_0419 [Actinokineospora spheciospongiae]|uniref:Uncharacterized protein n=1 Tax=Actinokineospora spheciospongiae TaxID=909613 RepID=W7J5M8_9PSEU|nr:hypothetical protein [Actinokineospora spheciospongiae]EWC64296.1 hypothetical protein UO65_0419 [Actinokineospora spheciospongiae]